MRAFVLGLAVVALGGGAALAQNRPPAAAPKAAPAPAATPAKYTLETPIHTLIEDPRMRVWLDKHFPGMSERMRDPEVGTLFDGVSIQGLSIDPDHGRALTPEVMAKLAKSLEDFQARPAPAS